MAIEFNQPKPWTVGQELTPVGETVPTYEATGPCMACPITDVVMPDCVDDMSAILIRNQHAIRVQFTLPTAGPGRVCYWDKADPSALTYTSPELNNLLVHEQWLAPPGGVSDCLDAGTSYCWVAQTRDTNGNWVPYTCEEQVDTLPCFNETSTDMLTSTSVRVTFTLGMNAPGRICYWPKNDKLAMKLYTVEELSSNFGAPGNPHIQTINFLQPNTEYVLITQIGGASGMEDDWSDYGCPVEIMTEPSVVSADKTDPALLARIAFWEAQGYTLAWSAQPDSSDLNANTAANYANSAKFTNGQPLSNYNMENGASSSISLAPDGTPAVRMNLVVNASGQPFACAQMRNTALGLNHTVDYESVVFLMEYWNDSVIGLDHHNNRGEYMGFGPHWGSMPGERHVPTGSNRQSTNRSFSMRVPLGASGNFSGYFYLPDWEAYHAVFPFTPPDSTAGQSLAFSGAGVFPTQDQWSILELEVKQNKPASAYNAEANLYHDGVFGGTAQGPSWIQGGNWRTRDMDDVRWRGFGYVFWHNPIRRMETMWYRCAAIFTRV